MDEQQIQVEAGNYEFAGTLWILDHYWNGASFVPGTYSGITELHDVKPGRMVCVR